MNNAENAAWYVVQTRVNGEARATCNLVRQGFEIYFPKSLKRQSHSRKVESVGTHAIPNIYSFALTWRHKVGGLFSRASFVRRLGESPAVR
jgi:transcriptional antiterminator RfaH